MSTSPIEHWRALAERVTVNDDTLTVDRVDGRSIAVPLAWYPHVVHATPKERMHWRLIGRGEGIHWPDLDEDIRVENLLSGIRSWESQRSLKQWLASRSR